MSADLERYKEQQRQQWSRAAEPWRRWHKPFSQMSQAATEAIVEAAQIGPGLGVLDLASGSGEPCLTVARMVGPEGSVVASDFVAEMVAVVEENVRRHGLTNVTCQQIDAEAIPFPDGSFDRVTCRFGVMFFPDTAKALREVSRVLKPGGRAAFTAWAPPELNPFFSAANGVLQRHGLLTPPPPDAPNVFRFARPGSLSGAMEASGLHQVAEEERPIAWQWPGGLDDFWEWYCQGTPVPSAVENLKPDDRETILAELRATFQQFE
ncbi:MAG: class I SAM-dependent methyltransferase, partial [Dehalococcoidia bacterium]|nr:class I SAM-dependent methyltransferase [Dehalococcoidia bacterium]